MFWIVDGRRVIICSDHHVGLLGLATCEVEGCGQVAKLVLTTAGVRLLRDFGAGNIPIRIQVLQSSHVDREEKGRDGADKDG